MEASELMEFWEKQLFIKRERSRMQVALMLSAPVIAGIFIYVLSN